MAPPGPGFPWPTNPFWDYSIAVYARPGVADACLELQERHGLDVNLLLLCCWLGSRGVRLDAPTAADLAARVGPWHAEVVRPLRRLRRHLKATIAAPAAGSVPHGQPVATAWLRQQIAAVELAAERLEQHGLADVVASLAPTHPSGPILAAANLADLFGFEPGDRVALTALLAGGFGAAGKSELAAALASIPA